jgi:hypothetical protein
VARIVTVIIKPFDCQQNCQTASDALRIDDIFEGYVEWWIDLADP